MAALVLDLIDILNYPYGCCYVIRDCMKIFIVFLIIFVWINLAFSDEIICFDNGKIIYRSEIENLSYDKNLFVFDEIKTKDIIVTNEKCTVKIKSR